MPEENTPPEQNKGGNEFTAITSQEQLNRLIGERINSVKSQYGDYDDLKAKAEKFDRAEQENKTELQKALDENATLKTELGGYKQRDQVRDWAKEIAKDSPDLAPLLRGSTKEELQEHFDQLKTVATGASRTQRTATPPGKPAPGQGEKGRAAAALREMRQGA